MFLCNGKVNVQPSPMMLFSVNRKFLVGGILLLALTAGALTPTLSISVAPERNELAVFALNVCQLLTPAMPGTSETFCTTPAIEVPHQAEVFGLVSETSRVFIPLMIPYRLDRPPKSSLQYLLV